MIYASKTRARRTPTDGEPFYCAVCSLGWNEYMACESPDCRLETKVESLARQASYRRALEGTLKGK